MTVPDTIIKRDGRIVQFNQEKITTAIFKAARATGNPDHLLAKMLSDRVVALIQERFAGKTPEVEEIQDIVEEVLISSGETKISKAYIIYRQKRTELRDLKRTILQGLADEETDLSINALKILEKRFLRKDAEGKLLETPSQMFRRVASSVAQAEGLYGGDAKATAERFYERMRRLEFLPNTPTLMNAGTPVQQLVASFVLPVEDNIESIFNAMKNAALIHKSGGGTGFSFSKLRPKRDQVEAGQGGSAGPLAFMHLFDAATGVMKNTGLQRGANIGILRIDHPDILEFINAKADGKSLANFSLSVGITDAFMEAAISGRDYKLINPRTGQPTATIPAKGVLDSIVSLAWQHGDPGILFLDRLNKDNPLPGLGGIEATDPCGDQPLLPYESAPLGAINLMSCASGNGIDWEKLRELVHDAVHFLDNAIDANKYPLPEIECASKNTRRIGIGIMGFADVLYHLKVPYDSEEGLAWAEKTMKFIKEEALAKSIQLAGQRGTFPLWHGSAFEQCGMQTRNASLLTLAPTGTISMIADISPSIEPNFAISYVRNVMGETDLVYVNKVFSREAKKKEIYSDQMMREIAEQGSIQHMQAVPEEMQRVFVTATDISPEWHIRMQAAFQKHVDNAISKTINFPADASLQDIAQAFLLAYRLGCKGITAYRDKSLDRQSIKLPQQRKQEEGQMQLVQCSECGAAMPLMQGKPQCLACGATLLQ